jgi:hypothetical protein
MKDPTEEHRSGSKEDIKKNTARKTHRRRTKKATPQYRRLV